MKLLKAIYPYESFEKWAQAYVVPKLAKVWHIGFIENVVK